MAPPHVCPHLFQGSEYSDGKTVIDWVAAPPVADSYGGAGRGEREETINAPA